MPVIDCKPDFLLLRQSCRTPDTDPPAGIPGCPDLYGVIGYAVDNHIVVISTRIIAVFSFQDCPYNLTCLTGRYGFPTAQPVKYQVRGTIVLRPDGCLVKGICNRPCPETLVKGKPLAVLLKRRRILA